MRYLLSAQEMKSWDSNTILQFHMLSMVLMERAALKVVDAMEQEGLDVSNVLVLCGTGNNGGDGIAIGRILFLAGSKVTVFMPGDRNHLTEETRCQLAIAEGYGMKTDTTLKKKPYTVIVDALFGIGLTRKISGDFREALLAVEALAAENENRNIPIVAVDMPSGIHSDTGEVMGVALKAALTVTFGAKKLGQVFYPGTEYCGKCVTAEIGITKESLLEMPKGFTYGREDLARLPKRAADGNKGTFGKLLVIAGSKDMCGAAYLSAMAAFRMGVGMVRIYTDAINRGVLNTLLPEAIVTTYKDKEAFRELEECMDWADGVVFGPGIGMNKCSKRLFEEVLRLLAIKKLPCVMDADALNLYSEQKQGQGLDFPVILTPHLGEMSRLTRMEISQIKSSLIETAVCFAREAKAVLVLKDARTVVSWGHDQFYLNSSGNSGMATAGSGDVLTGCIGALMVQGLELAEAARLGVYFHGLAGDAAAGEMGKESLMAGDIIRGIERVWKAYEEI